MYDPSSAIKTKIIESDTLYEIQKKETNHFNKITRGDQKRVCNELSWLFRNEINIIFINKENTNPKRPIKNYEKHD